MAGFGLVISRPQCRQKRASSSITHFASEAVRVGSRADRNSLAAALPPKARAALALTTPKRSPMSVAERALAVGVLLLILPSMALLVRGGGQEESTLAA
jgi:hypothetical protein